MRAEFGRSRPAKDGKGNRVMKLRNVIAAVASVGLMATPALAAAESAAATSAEVAPASETVDGQPIYGASILLQLGIVIAVAAAIYFAVDAIGGKDKPASP